MTPVKEKLTVFLAVPGTDLGETARWTRPQDVVLFFEKVCLALEQALQRPVELTVEKERPQAGVIYTTMFRAAYESDVFIADLTGANPNVFLELGARYALRRGVTLLVSQDMAKPPFNVEHLRVIQYANGLEEIAIEKIIAFVRGALDQPDYNDSPVQDVLDLVSIPRARWLKISGERAREYLRAAQLAATTSLEEAKRLLREAVDAAPLDVLPRLELTRHLRQQGLLQDALDVLDTGLRLNDACAELWLERGITLGRMPNWEPRDCLAEAAESLRKAAQLDPKSVDCLSSLGGALRRLALRQTEPGERLVGLQESSQQYLAARTLNPHSTYPALNLVRLGLHIRALGGQPGWDNDNLQDKTYHLCAFETLESPDDYWRALDLADALLYQGNTEASLAQYQRAVAAIPQRKRPDVLRSPQSTLLELQRAGALPAGMGPTANVILRELDSAILPPTFQLENEHERI